MGHDFKQQKVSNRMDHKAQVSPRPSTDRSPAKPSGHPLPHRILNWFAALDYGYRQAHKLSTLSDERLTDIGVSRAEADAAFYRKNQLRDAKHQPIKLSGPAARVALPTK